MAGGSWESKKIYTVYVFCSQMIKNSFTGAVTPVSFHIYSGMCILIPFSFSRPRKWLHATVLPKHLEATMIKTIAKRCTLFP